MRNASRLDHKVRQGGVLPNAVLRSSLLVELRLHLHIFFLFVAHASLDCSFIFVACASLDFLWIVSYLLHALISEEENSHRGKLPKSKIVWHFSYMAICVGKFSLAVISYLLHVHHYIFFGCCFLFVACASSDF